MRDVVLTSETLFLAFERLQCVLVTFVHRHDCGSFSVSDIGPSATAFSTDESSTFSGLALEGSPAEAIREARIERPLWISALTFIAENHLKQILELKSESILQPLAGLGIGISPLAVNQLREVTAA